MVGDEGPYIQMDGPLVWVPRTIPYLQARTIAKTGMDWGQRLRYLGKSDADLLGFTFDCRCEEVCERSRTDDEPNGTHPCRVPAWKFEVLE